MRVRVLTAWPGSGPCGSEGEYPDALARDQIRAGHAEPIAEVPVGSIGSPVETALPETSAIETATPVPSRPPRKGRRP